VACLVYVLAWLSLNCLLSLIFWPGFYSAKYLGPAHYSNQAHREPQWGPGKHSHGAPLGRKFLNVSFQNGTFWRTLYFWPMAGPPKRRRAWGS